MQHVSVAEEYGPATMRPIALSLVLFSSLVGCSASEKRSVDYAAVGPQGVGLHTYTFVDSSRPTMANHEFAGAPNRTLVVDVWYPAVTTMSPEHEAPLDKSGGPYPLIIHSHGFMDNRHGENFLGEHLASHGYVVAALDYPLSNGAAPGGATILDTANQPGDFKFVVDQLLAEAARPDSLIPNALDVSRLGASGLSLGALTTLLATFHPRLRDERVRAAFTMAPPACFLLPSFYTNAKVPLLIVHGEADLIVTPMENGVRAFERAQDPRELVLLRAGSHTGFTSLASLLDPTQSYDRIGCQAIAGRVDVSSFSTLGTEAEGISADRTVCPDPCTATPVDPPLDADRQHELATILAHAHFDANLKNDPSARRFLDEKVASENAEMDLRLR
jgi:predicted dienelactone hydrolase